MTSKKQHDPDPGAPSPDRKAEAPLDQDAQEPSTLEAFDEEGAGIAPKE